MQNSQMYSKPLHILVAVAHPHDFTHCAGTCGIHVESGDTVTVIAMMSGATMHNERLYDELLKPESERNPHIYRQTAEQYAADKEREFRQACALFGISDVRVLHCREPFRLHENPDAVTKLKEAMLDIRPDVVITQSPFYGGSLSGLSYRHGMANGSWDDHTQTAFAVQEAMHLASVPDYRAGHTPLQVAAVYYLGIYFMRDQIDFYIDVSDWIDRRVEAEALFESQGHSYEFARRRMEVTIGNAGYYIGTQYAEGFVRARPELLSKIHLSDIEVERAREARMEHIKRLGGMQ